jgi:hypothetical protein
MGPSKKVILSVLSREQSEGVGARVRRSIGRPEVCWLGHCALLFFFLRGTGGRLKVIWEEKAKTVMSFPVGSHRYQLKLHNWGSMWTSPSPDGISKMWMQGSWAAGAAGILSVYLCLTLSWQRTCYLPQYTSSNLPFSPFPQFLCPQFKSPMGLNSKFSGERIWLGW